MIISLLLYLESNWGKYTKNIIRLTSTATLRLPRTGLIHVACRWDWSQRLPAVGSSFLAHYPVKHFHRDLGEILGRILAAEIFGSRRDLAEIPDSRRSKSCRESRRDSKISAAKIKMIFLTCQKSWNFLHRMISGYLLWLFHTIKASKAKNQFPCFTGDT